MFLFTLKEPMTRFLCFSLTLLFALPAFAQNESAPAGLDLPQDPAQLMRLREDLTFQIQEVQRLLSFVNPSDTRTTETLQTRQAELTQQLRSVIDQMQTAAPSGTGRNTGMMSPPGMPSGLPQSLPVQSLWGQGGMNGHMPPGMIDPTMNMSRNAEMPGMPTSGMMQGTMPNPPMQAYPPAGMIAPVPPIPAHWMNQTPPGWGVQTPGATQEASLPKELTDMKQTVEALRREISELKETVKSLETQIQLLNRNIVLSERVRENGM